MITQPQKQDPRIIRTRQALRQALLELLTERGFQQISVKSITERAGLNRTTFYLHYQNKEDLLSSEFSAFRDRLLAAFPFSFSSSAEKPAGLSRDSMVMNFRRLKEYQPFYQAMLGEKRYPAVKRRLADDLLERVLNDWQDRESDQYPAEGALAFLVAAYLGLLEWWLENSCRQSADRMADLAVNLHHRSPAEVLVWISNLDKGISFQERNPEGDIIPIKRSAG